MADATQGWFLEVRRGASGTDHVAFPRGQPVQPMSLGLRGQWRIEADGVLDVHGYVYFDGQSLFVQSASLDSPLRVNGQPMGAQWAAVGAPCTIALGDARLVFHDAAEGITRAPNVRPAAGMTSGGPISGGDFDATRVHQPTLNEDEELDGETRALPVANFGSFGPPAAPPMPQATQRATAPRAAHDDRTGDIALPPSFRDKDDEPTKAIPIPPEVPEPPPPPMPMGAPPTGGFAQHGLPPPAFSQAQPTTPQPMVATAPNAQIHAHDPTPRTNPQATVKIQRQGGSLAEKLKPILTKLGEDWRATSLPKKAILALLPVAFVMVIVAFSEKEPPPSTKAPPKGTSAATASATTTKTKAMPTTATSPTPTTSAPEVATTAPMPIPSPSPSPLPPPTPTPSASVATTDKTTERAAVDAVVSGDYAQAAKLYAQLATEHPENPAYAEAAKILRRKAAQK